jgi:GxxExxY protein
LEKEAFCGLESELTDKIIRTFYEVYNELGFGFNECVYSRAMAIALTQRGLKVASEVNIPVSFRGQLVGSFRADVVVEGKVVLELKIADQIVNAHEAQLTHYLRASTFEIGFVLSFGAKPQKRRIEFLNTRKRNL